MSPIVAKVITWIVLVALTAGLLVEHFTKPKTGYIVIQEVFAQFDLKKELEQKFTITKNARQKVLDSLAFELKLIAKKLDAEKMVSKEHENSYNRQREEFYQRRQAFIEDNAELTKEYDQEILTQLNQYVGDYGKENGYQYIFGNDGSGSLMHAKETQNITKEVAKYINEKYKGRK